MSVHEDGKKCGFLTHDQFLTMFPFFYSDFSLWMPLTCLVSKSSFSSHVFWSIAQGGKFKHLAKLLRNLIFLSSGMLLVEVGGWKILFLSWCWWRNVLYMQEKSNFWVYNCHPLILVIFRDTKNIPQDYIRPILKDCQFLRVARIEGLLYLYS